MIELFHVLFWESAFSALDSSNCQMRKKKKKKKDQLYYLFLFWGEEGRAQCQQLLPIWRICQFRTCRYVHFLLIIVYIWFINLIIKSLKISFPFIYVLSSLKVLIVVEAYQFLSGFSPPPPNRSKFQLKGWALFAWNKCFFFSPPIPI